jgi:hypothetical protein
VSPLPVGSQIGSGVVWREFALPAGEQDQGRCDREHRYFVPLSGRDEFLERGVDTAAAEPDQYSDRGVEYSPAFQ